MKIETPIFAVLLCGITFLGLFGFLSETSINSGVDISADLQVYNAKANSTSLQRVFDRINETKATTDSISTQYDEAKQDPVNTLFGFGKLAKNIGTTILDSVTTLKDMMEVLANLIDIPVEVVTAFVAIIMISIVLGLIYLLLGVVKD